MLLVFGRGLRTLNTLNLHAFETPKKSPINFLSFFPFSNLRTFAPGQPPGANYSCLSRSQGPKPEETRSDHLAKSRDIRKRFSEPVLPAEVITLPFCWQSREGVLLNTNNIMQNQTTRAGQDARHSPRTKKNLLLCVNIKVAMQQIWSATICPQGARTSASTTALRPAHQITFDWQRNVT